MFGWRNTRTEQVTRSAVTPSLKYIWVNQLLVPNLTNNSKCVTGIMSYSSFKRDKIDEILTSVNVIFNVPRDIVCKQLIISVRNLHCILLLHLTHFSKVNCTLDKVNCTFCVRKHNFRPCSISALCYRQSSAKCRRRLCSFQFSWQLVPRSRCSMRNECVYTACFVWQQQYLPCGSTS